MKSGVSKGGATSSRPFLHAPPEFGGWKPAGVRRTGRRGDFQSPIPPLPEFGGWKPALLPFFYRASAGPEGGAISSRPFLHAPAEFGGWKPALLPFFYRASAGPEGGAISRSGVRWLETGAPTLFSTGRPPDRKEGRFPVAHSSMLQRSSVVGNRRSYPFSTGRPPDRKEGRFPVAHSSMLQRSSVVGNRRSYPFSTGRPPDRAGGGAFLFPLFSPALTFRKSPN